MVESSKTAKKAQPKSTSVNKTTLAKKTTTATRVTPGAAKATPGAPKKAISGLNDEKECPVCLTLCA